MCGAQQQKQDRQHGGAGNKNNRAVFDGHGGNNVHFSEGLSQCIYGDGQCAEYLRVLAPLLPIMYTDTTVDGILKGLDQQVYSMRYNIIDSAMCVVLVLILIPKYSVKGYVAILLSAR